MSAQPYAKAARIYAGTPFADCIIPLPVGKKFPPPIGSTGYDGETTREAVAEWVRSSPAANVGLRVPRWLVGIDVDGVDHAEGKTGPASITAFERQNGELPATVYSTRHGAGSPTRILFFEVPEGIRLSEKKLTAVEIVQHHHRFAVVSPSRLHDGSRYRWYSPDGERLRAPSRADIERLPDAWIESLAASDDYARGMLATDADVAAFLEGLRSGAPSFILQATVARPAEVGNTGLLGHVGTALRACQTQTGGRAAFELMVENLRAPYEEKYGRKKFEADLSRVLSRVVGDINAERLTTI